MKQRYRIYWPLPDNPNRWDIKGRKECIFERWPDGYTKRLFYYIQLP